MRDVPIHRPITTSSLAEALGTMPYRVLAELIKMAVFPAPGTAIDDLVANELAARRGVNLRIIDDEDDGFTMAR